MARDAGSVLSRRAVLGGMGAMVAVAATGCSRGRGGDPDRVGETAEVAYGDAALQRGGLWLPTGAASGPPRPVVVLVHGGFWRPGYDRTLMDPLAATVVAAGWAAWNVDYRPTGDGGGWPTTFTDVARGVDHLAALAEDHPLDPARVAVVGHSAGGTLALWAAARPGLPAGAPGAGPVVRPVAAVALAGVTSLVAAAFEELGRGAAEDLMGGPPTGDREREYALASPSDRLPLGVPQLLVHGADDPVVPPRQSRAHADRARAEGDEATARVLAGVDHFDVIDPATAAWAGTLAWLRPHL